MRGVRKPCKLVICTIFLSFTSFERPLLNLPLLKDHPLTPLLQGKKSIKLPSILIESIAERKIVLIQLKNEG